MYDGEKNTYIIIFRVVYLICLPPFNSNFRYFEIKSLVPRISNFRDPVTIFDCMIIIWQGLLPVNWQQRFYVKIAATS